jgi:ubiquinone/menaquinone biosynthesis C-methylase UbiE
VVSLEEKEKLKKLNNEEFAAWTDAVARKYDIESYYLRSGLSVRLIEKLRVMAVENAVRSKNKDLILEVGVGGGHVLEKIGQGRLIGIDISDTMLVKAKKRLEHRKVILIKANAEILPFPEKVFHKVICTEVLEHVQDPKQVIAEIVRVSKPGAVVIISIPNDYLIHRIRKLIFNLRLNSFLVGKGYNMPVDTDFHLHIFNLKMLKDMLTENMSIVKIKAIPSPIIPLRYVITCTKLNNRDLNL